MGIVCEDLADEEAPLHRICSLDLFFNNRVLVMPSGLVWSDPVLSGVFDQCHCAEETAKARCQLEPPKVPTGVIKSVLSTTRTDPGRRDDIFVDVVEKVSSTFNSGGYIQNSQIDGSIQVHSNRAAA